MLVYYLVDPEPDTSIIVVKWDHMINKGLWLRMIFWGVKGLVQHFLHQLKVRCLVEGRIEGQQGSWILQAVACKFQFVHCVNVLHCKLDAWALRRFHDPQKEIRLLPCLQENAIVAWPLVAQIVYIILSYLSLNLILLFGVWQKLY